MRLLLFNLAVDLEDEVLAFATTWINELAKEVDQIDTITMKKGKVNVSENVSVYSAGKERGFSRSRRLFRFYRILLSLLTNYSYDGCFSHMMPLFSAAGGPFLYTFNIPLITWYAHRNQTTTLKWAHLFSSHVVSVNESSYPYKKDKFVSLGHGIDTSYFSPADSSKIRPPLILSVGRLSPIKDPKTFIEAMSIIRARGVDFEALLVGDAPERDRPYKQELINLIDRKDNHGRVQLEGSVPYQDIISYYRQCTIHINSSPPDHSVDKAALEAMASGKPSLTSVKALKPTLGRYRDELFFEYGNPKHLANKMSKLLKKPDTELRSMGEYLRERIQEKHSLKHLKSNLISLLESSR